MTRFFVISDLHCKHLEKDSHEDDHFQLYSNKLRKPKEKHPIESLLTFLIEKDIKADYLICPGDLADKIDTQGLISGYNFLNEVSNILKSKMIFLTTGNHDIDLYLNHKEYSDKFYITKNFHAHYPIENKTLNDNYWLDNFYLYEDEKLILVNLNSSKNILPDSVNIDEETINKLKESISKIKGDKIRIFLCHHHPIKFSNYSVKYKDNDVIDNGDVLLDILSRNKFNLLIHGHKHIPRINVYDNVNIFCAGSFSCLHNVISSGGKTVFHLIEIDDNINMSNFRCQIKTYENSMTAGWRYSIDNKYFPAITGLGANIDIPKISKQINSIIQEYLEWEDIIKSFPDLKYLNPKQQDELESELKSKFNIHYYSTTPGLIPNRLIKA
ncbi:MAG: metallophosphoesterase [Saprospiraceae bacterium]|nr:metallophosphoesterase [Candidatus Opimibacter iunctus]